jgi:phosphoribosyl-AMP cyclohydrolase
MSATTKLTTEEYIRAVKFDCDGLVAAVAQDALSREVLMVAWMNEAALRSTLSEGRAVYWSRSRNELWRKGDKSGHTQTVQEVWLDCDGDTVLLKVTQTGPACHTGAPTCFFRKHERA